MPCWMDPSYTFVLYIALTWFSNFSQENDHSKVAILSFQMFIWSYCFEIVKEPVYNVMVICKCYMQSTVP